MKSRFQSLGKGMIVFFLSFSLFVSSVIPAHAASAALSAGDIINIVSILVSLFQTSKSSSSYQDAKRDLDKYWSSTISASNSVEVSADDLYEVCMNLNTSGIPVEVSYSNAVGYVLRGVGFVDMPDSSGLLYETIGDSYDLRGLYLHSYDGRIIYASSKHSPSLLTVANTYLQAIQRAINSTNSYLSQIIGYVDGIEGLISDVTTAIGDVSGKLVFVNQKLTTLIGHVDGVEDLISTGNSRLSSLISNVDQVEEYIDQIEGRMLKTVGSSSYTLADLGYNAWQQLQTIDGHVDGLESAASSISGYVDGVESELEKISGRLIKKVGETTFTLPDLTYSSWQQLIALGGYVDGLESTTTTIANRLLKKTVDDVSYSAADLIYNTWQRLQSVDGHIDGIEDLITTGNSRLSSVISNVDQVEGYLDQVKSRMLKTVGTSSYTLADLGYNAWQQLQTIDGHVDGLESAASSISGYVDGVESELEKVSGRLIKRVGETTYTLPDLTYSSWQQLVTIGGYVDGLEGGLTSLSGYVDGLESTTSTIASRLLKKTVDNASYTAADLLYSSWQSNLRLESFIDQVEGRMLKTVNGSSYTLADLGYNALQQLSSGNDKLTLISSKLDDVLDNMSQHLTADVTVDVGDVTFSPDDSALTNYVKFLYYQNRDIYTTLGAIATDYKNADSYQQSVYDSILNRYWYSPGSAPYSVWVTGDQLREIQLHMIDIGYYCSIVYDDSYQAYVIKITGNPRVSDLISGRLNTASGISDLYDSSTPYYLANAGFCYKSSNKDFASRFSDFENNFNTRFSNLHSLIDTKLSSSLSLYQSQLTAFNNGVDKLDDILDLLSERLQIDTENHEHTYVRGITQEATCTVPGLATYTCSECGYGYSELLPALGHDYDFTEHVAAEYDEDGVETQQAYDVYTCTRCEHVERSYDSSTPASGDTGTISDLIARIFSRLGKFVGGIFSGVIKLLDDLLTGFDSLVSDFNDKAQEISSFGGDYPDWLGGIWEVIPDELQLALGFCLVVALVGIVGKKLVFTS